MKPNSWYPRTNSTEGEFQAIQVLIPKFYFSLSISKQRDNKNPLYKTCYGLGPRCVLAKLNALLWYLIDTTQQYNKVLKTTLAKSPTSYNILCAPFHFASCCSVLLSPMSTLFLMGFFATLIGMQINKYRVTKQSTIHQQKGISYEQRDLRMIVVLSLRKLWVWCHIWR